MRRLRGTSNIFWPELVNSLIVSIGTMVGIVVLALMVSFVIARYEFKFNKLLYSLFAAGMMFPITVAITKYLGTDTAHYGQLAVAATVSAIPAIVFALCIQKHLVRGLSFGAVKG